MAYVPVSLHLLICSGYILSIKYVENNLSVSSRGYRCPLCMHSALDMTRYWRQLDDEVAQTPMPSEYQNMTVDVSRINTKNFSDFLLILLKFFVLLIRIV